jgi:hypothetical protein
LRVRHKSATCALLCTGSVPARRPKVYTAPVCVASPSHAAPLAIASATGAMYGEEEEVVPLKLALVGDSGACLCAAAVAACAACVRCPHVACNS